MRWPPGASVPTCSPEGGKTCLPGPGPLSPTRPAACDDEMAAWAAARRDGFQALKWAEIDEHPREGHFFFKLWSKENPVSWPSASGAGFSPPSLGTTDVLTVQTSSGRRGAHTGLGQDWGGGLLGISLGLAPRVLPSRGLREKVPGYRGTV